MLETTLVYIEQDGKLLMLHRVRKQEDVNAGKWIGVGGKIEPGETPEACMLRETREETGLTLQRWAARGIVDFRSGDWKERMHLFTADCFEGTLDPDCDEGVLAWVERERVLTLPLWAGDRVFLRLLEEGEPFFRLTLIYEGERLAQAWLNGRLLEQT